MKDHPQKGFTFFGILFFIILVIFGYFVFKYLTARFLFANDPGRSYLACGCGCCGGAKPNVKCLFHLKGDDLNKIIKQDQQNKNSKECALVGCSLGTSYIYCD